MNEELQSLLKKLSDPMNWGYIDESGCAKGAGSYTEAWIGKGEHPMILASRIISVDNINETL